MSAVLARLLTPRRAVSALLLSVVAALSCGREPTGINGGQQFFQIALQQEWPEAYQVAGPSLVPFTKVRVVLRRTDGTVAFDQLVDFPSTAQTIDVSITVPISANAPPAGESMAMSLDYVNAQGQVVFQASSPLSVPPAPPAGSPPPPPVPVVVVPRYVGPGATAVRVSITPGTATVAMGGSYTFTAQGLDANGAAVPNTPIIFTTSNSAIAPISATGSGTAGNVRGTATITAALLTGGTPATAFVTVTPRATSVGLVSGSGQTAVVGGTLTNLIVARVLAADGLPMSGVLVSFTPSAGGAALPGNGTTGADGTASTQWVLGPTVGAQTMTIASPGLTSVTATATATARPATALAFTTQPVGGSAGEAIGTVVVTARDAQGQTATTFTGAVTLTLAGGGSSPGTLGGAATANAVAGVATFTGLTVSRAGTGYTLNAASGSLTAATSSAFNVTTGAVARLAIRAMPTSGTSDVVFATQPSIELRDANGDLVTSATNTVTVAVGTVNNGAGVLGGNLSVAAVAGVANFAGLRFTGAATITLTFSAANMPSVTSGPIVITGAGPQIVSTPSAVEFTAERGGANPASRTAVLTSTGGQITNLEISGIRYEGTRSGWLTASVANQASGGAATPVNTPAVITLSVTTGTLPAGRHGATVDLTSSGRPSPVVVVFVVTPLPPTKLAITTQPANVVSGVAMTTFPIVELRDRNDGRVDGATNTVTAALASGTGTLAGTTTVAAVDGVARFTNLRVNGLGVHSLVFTSGTLTSTTSGTFPVTQAPASLAVTTQPGGAVSGNNLSTQPVVEIRDQGGVKVAGATNAITASIFSGSGALVGTATVNAVDGVATFTNLRINGFGAHVLAFSGSGVPVGSNSSSFTVTQQVTSLAITTAPAGGLNGQPISPQPVVQLRDAAGIRVEGSTLAVTAAILSGPSGGTLGGTVTVNAVNGIASFTNLALSGVGSYTLQFSTATPALTVAGTAFSVTTGPPSLVAITTQPGGANSGSPFGTQPVVEVRDAGGVRATSYIGTVTVVKASGGGTLTGTTTVNVVNGIATFTNLQINGGGAHTLTFSSGTLSSATSSSFTVTQVAVAVAIQTQPAGASSGVAFTTQPVVRIVDAAGLTVVGATNSVTATIATGTGTLGGTTTVAAVNGIATFTNLMITGSGCHSLGFTSASPPLTGATSQSIGLGGGSTACGLAVTTQPSATAESGVNFGTQPVVAIRDGFNTTVASSTAPVTVALASGTGTLSGTTTVNAVAGFATFSGLKIAGAGAHTLVFTSPGLTSATSSTITVSQTPATLSISRQVSSANSGSAFGVQPQVTVVDAGGLGVPGITVTAAKATGSGTLGGILAAVTNSSGVATWTNLMISGTGNHSLTFSTTSPALSATGTVFSVANNPPTQISIAQQPGSVATSGVAIVGQPRIELRDASNALITDAFNVVASIASGTGTLAGTTTVATVGGVATFTNLQINGAGAHTIKFDVTGTALTATSSTVTVSQVAASLQIQTQPAGSFDGVAFTTQPVVRILDNAGLLVTTGSGATLSVTAAKASGSGTLGGTMTVTAAGGVATFTNLMITGSGAHTLSFSTTSPALSVTSASFTTGVQAIVVNVGASATASVANGGQITIPIMVDMTNRGTLNVSSVQVTVTWDPTKFTYMSNANGGWVDSNGDPASVTSNTASVATGSFLVNGFTTAATTASFTLRTITLQAIATAAPTMVSAAVNAIGNVSGASVAGSTTPRNLSVTISP